MITRLGLNGYGTRLAGSFAGKPPAAGSGPHPVDKITRLALSGYMGKRAGSFSGKTPGAGSGPHPVGNITRLSLSGYMARRVGSFADKLPTETEELQFYAGGTLGELQKRRKYVVSTENHKDLIHKDDNEIMEIIQIILMGDLL